MVRSTPASANLAVDVTATAPDAFQSSSSPLPQTSLRASLIDARFDQDSCGVGFVASIAATASHTILTQALTALGRLAHRGAVAADGKSSDGVGVTTAVPRALLLRETGLSLGDDQTLAVGMLFLPAEETRAEA
jgi:glutamate synthase (ferredoxin)